MSNNILITSLLLILIVIIFSFKSSLFFLNLTKKYEHAKTLNKYPYPPKDINPIDLWILSNPEHNLNIEKLSSILIYYANKGLITVSYLNHSYSLRKTRPLTIHDFQNQYEYDFINKLFEIAQKSDGSIILETIPKKDLNFFTNLIYQSKESNLKKDSYLIQSKKNYNLFFYILTFPVAIISMFLFLLYALNNFYYSLIFTSMLSIICILLIPINYLLKNIHWLLSFILSSLFMFILLKLIFSFTWLTCANIPLIPLLLISFGFSLLSSQQSPRRYIHTDNGLSLIKKTIELKNFISLSNLNELNQQLTNNKTYYYDILPYAICFNILPALDKAVDNIDLPNPKWFLSDTKFKYHHFERMYLLEILKLYHNTAK